MSNRETQEPADVPADVNEVVDRDGDKWTRIGGYWKHDAQYGGPLVKPLADIVSLYGPVTWVGQALVEVPAKVNTINDSDGDNWYRLADGRWVCAVAVLADGNEPLIAPFGDLVELYGPVTW